MNIVCVIKTKIKYAFETVDSSKLYNSTKQFLSEIKRPKRVSELENMLYIKIQKLIMYVKSFL